MQIKNITKKILEYLITFKNVLLKHKIKAISSLAIIIIICFVCGYYNRINNVEEVFEEHKQERREEEEPKEPTQEEILGGYDVNDYYDNNIITIALLGFDTSDQRREDYTGWSEGFTGARADGIKIVCINLDSDKIDIINIPRDTYVPIADIDWKDKVNSAYYWGREKAYEADHGVTPAEQHKNGIEFQLKTLSNLFVPIDYYVCVDFDFIIKFIDYLGGIKFYCDHDIYEIFENGEKGELMLENKLYDPANGYGELNGTQAFIYMQDRKNIADGDFSRTENHTKLLLAIADHIKENRMYIKAIQFMKDIGIKMIETDLSFDQMMALANMSLKFNFDDIGNHTLTSSGRMKDGTYYAAMHQDVRVQILKDVFNMDAEPWPKDVFIDTTPQAVMGLCANAYGDVVSLSWEKGDKHNRTFDIIRNGQTIASGISDLAYTDSNPIYGDNVYKVIAVNGDTKGAATTTTINIGGVGMPRSLSAVQNPDGRITVSWDHSQKGTVDFYITRTGTDGSSLDFNSTKDIQFVDGPLKTGVTYTYFMRAANQEGVKSNTASTQITIQ